MKRAITVGALAVATGALVPVPQAHAVGLHGGCVMVDVRPAGPVVDPGYDFELEMAARRDVPMPPWPLPTYPQVFPAGTTTVVCDIKRADGSIFDSIRASRNGYVVAASYGVTLGVPRGQNWSVCGWMTGSDSSYEDLGCHPFTT